MAIADSSSFISASSRKRISRAHPGITTLAGWPGDFNQDDNIDLEDFALFQACFTGSGLGVPTGCELMDVDGDDDVDLDDFSDFHGSFVGP